MYGVSLFILSNVRNNFSSIHFDCCKPHRVLWADGDQFINRYSL